MDVYQVSVLRWRDDDYYEAIWLIEAKSALDAITQTQNYIGNDDNYKHWRAHTVNLREPYIISFN